MTGRTRPRPHMFVWFLTAATARSWASAFAVSTALTSAAAASAARGGKPVHQHGRECRC